MNARQRRTARRTRARLIALFPPIPVALQLACAALLGPPPRAAGTPLLPMRSGLTAPLSWFN